MSLDSLSRRRGENWIRRWTKRKRRPMKHKALDGHARIRLTPYLPSFAKLLLASILFMVLIELVACVAVLYVVLTTGAK